jgi:hypothetical protein
VGFSSRSNVLLVGQRCRLSDVRFRDYVGVQEDTGSRLRWRTYFVVGAQPCDEWPTPSDDNGLSADEVSPDGHALTAYNAQMAKK